MNPKKSQEPLKTKARLLSDLDLEADEEPQWKFMRLSPSPTLDQALFSALEVPQRIHADEDAHSLEFDAEDFLCKDSSVPLVPPATQNIIDPQQSVASQPLWDLFDDASLFHFDVPMTPPPMEDQAKEADLPSLLEIGNNIAAMPLSTTTSTTTAAPLQQLPPFAVHTFQCSNCNTLVKASSLFAKNPSCPNCTTACLQSITNATASMFELVATCKDGHTCNQSCLKRSDNANRVCPYFGCTSSLKYTCKKCGKQGSYQCLTKKNHKCFDEHRRKGGSAK